MREVYTYIIKTKKEEYYCGKSIDVFRRLKQHKKEKEPHWFSFNNRRNWKCVLYFKGNFEKQIKRAGVKFIYDLTMCEVSAP